MECKDQIKVFSMDLILQLDVEMAVAWPGDSGVIRAYT